jgi:ABC-2 type transport system ATP-binding protein
MREPVLEIESLTRRFGAFTAVDLRAAYGTTLVFTTHYLEEAEAHCDRIAIMHLGQLAAVGTCKKLEAAFGGGHTLNEVFAHHAGGTLGAGGTFREVSAERATALRLG